MSSAFSAVREMTKSKIVGFLSNDDDEVHNATLPQNYKI